MQYFSHHIGDFIRDTAHLSLLEDGVYRRLIDLYYTAEGPLAADLKSLCRHIRARSTEEVQAVEQVLSEFFTLTDEGWRHKRCDAELAAYRAKSDKARASAEHRWRNADKLPAQPASAFPSHCETDPNAMPSECDRIAKAMLTNNQEPITNKKRKNKEKEKNETSAPTPDWLPNGAWLEWLDFRKRVSGKKFTPRAMELNLAELAKLHEQGFEPSAVIEQSIARGWTGLFPLKANARASPSDLLGEAGLFTANAAAAWLQASGGENEGEVIPP